MKTKTILLIVLVAFTACKNRDKLNSNEQQLAQQISAEEKAKQEAEAANQNNNIMPDTLPPGFRFKEERSVDPQKPPEIIDIAGNLENKKAIRLSDLGNKITYIRLAPPPDSLFFYRAPQIRFTKTHIIATSHLATCVYSLKGEFIDIISKDEFDPPRNIPPPPPFPADIPYFAKYYEIPESLQKTRKKRRGLENKGLSDIYNNNFSGKDIYFKYRDKENDKSYLMKYNISKDSKILSLPDDNETKNVIISKGEKIAALNNKSNFRYHVLDENSKIGHQSKWNSTRNGIMLLLENMKGDTLCIFHEPERITNYDASVVRSVESGSKYFYKNRFTYRPAFNDTVFRLIPPNRLLPVFIINLGEHKVSALEALHPRYGLNNKFLINHWVETTEHIFIRYTENRVSINNIRKKFVRFHYSFYDKNSKQLFHIPVNPLNYIYEIENDIDGGLPLWPEQTTPDRKLYKSFEGWELKRHVNSEQFKKSTVLQEKKEKIASLAESVGDAETIIMIIE